MVERREYVGGVERIYTKTGGKLLLDADGDIDMQHLVLLANDFTEAYESGKELVHVSSGAIVSGCNSLVKSREELYEGLSEEESIHRDQAIAATGQYRMMGYYEEAFKIFKQPVAQIMLSSDKLKDRESRLNLWNTYRHLRMLGIMPIVNNDDTMTTVELRYSENDALWADLFLFLEGFHADKNAMGVIFSEHELYDSDPRKNPIARVIPVIEKIDGSIMELASDVPGEYGFGGMSPKLDAIKYITGAGYPVALVRGKYKDRKILRDVLAGEETGTFFLPR